MLQELVLEIVAVSPVVEVQHVHEKWVRLVDSQNGGLVVHPHAFAQPVVDLIRGFFRHVRFFNHVRELDDRESPAVLKVALEPT